MNSIPKDFESWKDCIENQCKIQLTLKFVQARIAVYANPELEETCRFIARYGEQHHQHILSWYRRVEDELNTEINI